MEDIYIFLIGYIVGGISLILIGFLVLNHYLFKERKKKKNPLIEAKEKILSKFGVVKK